MRPGARREPAEEGTPPEEADAEVLALARLLVRFARLGGRPAAAAAPDRAEAVVPAGAAAEEAAAPARGAEPVEEPADPVLRRRAGAGGFAGAAAPLEPSTVRPSGASAVDDPRWYAVWAVAGDTRLAGLHHGAGLAAYHGLLGQARGCFGALRWRRCADEADAEATYLREAARRGAPRVPGRFWW